MRGLMTRWEMSLRDRVRAWLFGEEIQILGNLKYQVKNLGDVLAQSIHHESSIIAALNRIEATQTLLYTKIEGTELRLIRMEQEQLQRIEAAQNRIFDLVQPMVKEQRRPVPVVPSWEQVQAEQLREFEENTR